MVVGGIGAPALVDVVDDHPGLRTRVRVECREPGELSVHVRTESVGKTRRNPAAPRSGR
jgi:hypothetical protein